MPSVVIDTNIFVSALLKKFSPTRIVIDAFLNGEFTLATSEELFAELIDALKKAKIMPLIDSVEAAFLLESIRRHAVVIAPAEMIKGCRDAKDDIVLQTAVAAGADVIVTGDGDLLTLNPFRNIRILPPKKFIEELKTPGR